MVIRIEEPITVVQSWKNFLDHLETKFLEPGYSWIPLSARSIVWSEDYCRGTSINRLCSKEMLTLPCRMVWFFIQDHSVGFANTRKQEKENYLIFI